METMAEIKSLFALSDWLRERNDSPIKHSVVYRAANLLFAIELAAQQTPEKSEALIAQIRRSFEWALGQHRCGNMKDRDVFEYLFFMVAQINPDDVIRGLAERLRLAESDRDHLRYLKSTEQF